MSADLCCVASCPRRSEKRGRCDRHYKQYRRSGDFEYAPFRRDELVPTVCVCDLPIADGLGECRWCFRPFKPRFAAQRAQWRAFLTAQGVDLNIPRLSGYGRDVRARSAPSPNHAAKDENDG